MATARRVSRQFCSTDHGSRPRILRRGSVKSPARNWPTYWSRWALEPQRLARALAQEYRLPFQAHIDENSLDSKLVSKVPINYAKKNRLLPLSSLDGAVTIAMADPANSEPLDDLRILFGAQINVLIAPAEVIAEAINRAYDQASATSAEDLMIDLQEERSTWSPTISHRSRWTCSSPTIRRRSSSSSTACCRRRSRIARRTSTSKLSKKKWWCASGWTA